MHMHMRMPIFNFLPPATPSPANMQTYLVIDARGLVLDLDVDRRDLDRGGLDHVGEKLVDARHRLHL